MIYVIDSLVTVFSKYPSINIGAMIVHMDSDKTRAMNGVERNPSATTQWQEDKVCTSRLC